jgi:hypothetical protein
VLPTFRIPSIRSNKRCTQRHRIAQVKEKIHVICETYFKDEQCRDYYAAYDVIITMKISSCVGTEKKETNPVGALDKISKLDNDGIRVKSNHFGKMKNLASVIVTFLENCVQRYDYLDVAWSAHNILGETRFLEIAAITVA